MKCHLKRLVIARDGPLGHVLSHMRVTTSLAFLAIEMIEFLAPLYYILFANYITDNVPPPSATPTSILAA
jgi:hypothetical protein